MWDNMDGKWISPIVDHMCILLVEYAKAADAEMQTNPYSQAQDSTSSDSQKIESSLSLMEQLFRRLQQGE